MDELSAESQQEAQQAAISQAEHEETGRKHGERKARVNAVWQQMNKGVSNKTLKSILEKRSSTTNKTSQRASQKMSSPSWMTSLGLAPKTMSSPGQDVSAKCPSISQNGASDEAKKLAAAALSAVKDAAALAAVGRGKIEISEVRDFAGEEVEVRKFVDSTSKEASDKGKGTASSVSAVDAVLEQIKKKQKLSVLDKTKKDWGEFKEENKGLEEELDAYKKSSNQYLDRVSFLQRSDYREFERERDARLASQAKRKVGDMREDF
ncbi:Hypothetical predicted protein [Olea europaea subsp. europaea]|uniref:BCNT-C domain-containing protein n=1 Tax=Olea europaea subsp. europaea TaxID=158383 RepID=A0A8S0VBQ2_OLEEU|nr:Hypothetical predicted protein [Olea europaea subsp. europaea]